MNILVIAIFIIEYTLKRMKTSFYDKILKSIYKALCSIRHLRGTNEAFHSGRKDTILSNEEIITMDWLFSNIVGEIPAKYELKEQAKSIVELQGVKGEKE